MDMNLVVLSGRLAAPVEVRTFESGSHLLRLLMTVRSEAPRRRVDVVPVTLWDPADRILEALPYPGGRLWVAGSVQRRFTDIGRGRTSRLEVVAAAIAADAGGLDLPVDDGDPTDSAAAAQGLPSPP